MMKKLSSVSKLPQQSTPKKILVKKSTPAPVKKIKDKVEINQSNQKQAIYFVSGFDWFSAGSVKGNSDGMKDLSENIKGSKLFSWDQQDELISDIKKLNPQTKVALVGHSFGGDSIVEVANELNSLENGFRQIDLMVTLDSVGFDNDIIPSNVKKNLNYIAQGPYHFLNDAPNIARSLEETIVKNMLTQDAHSDIDDNKEHHRVIFKELNLLA